jgi:hypothetical protein
VIHKSIFLPLFWEGKNGKGAPISLCILMTGKEQKFDFSLSKYPFKEKYYERQDKLRTPQRTMGQLITSTAKQQS